MVIGNQEFLVYMKKKCQRFEMKRVVPVSIDRPKSVPCSQRNSSKFQNKGQFFSWSGKREKYSPQGDFLPRDISYMTAIPKPRIPPSPS